MFFLILMAITFDCNESRLSCATDDTPPSTRTGPGVFFFRAAPRWKEKRTKHLPRRKCQQHMAMPSGQKITTGQSQLLKLSSGLLNQKNHRFSLKNQDGNLAELWEVVLTLLDKVRIFWVPALHFFHAPKTHKKKGKIWFPAAKQHGLGVPSPSLAPRGS